MQPELVDEYRRRHERVWPEMLSALAARGRRNYSLFIADDGLVVGYYESDRVSATLVNDEDRAVFGRWQAAMSDLFVHPREPVALSEVFHLETQVSAQRDLS